MSSLDNFSNRFIQAVARSKQKAKQPVQATQHVHAQRAQKINGNVVTAPTKTNSLKLSDEQYRVNIINLAIEHIKMKWSL